MSGAEAVVLAAGEGRRLRPLTRFQPKPMLPVGGRPIIEYPLEALGETGVERAVVVVGHGGQRVRNHLENQYQGIELTYVTQESQAGSGHALEQARSHVGDEFLVVNGDNVIDAAIIEGVRDRYQPPDTSGVVAVISSDRPDQYGTVSIEEGLVVGIDDSHPGESARVNAGVYQFNRSIFNALDRTAFVNGERPITGAIEELEGAVVTDGKRGIWYDPSYLWDLLSTNEAILANHPELLRSSTLVDPTARIHPTAVVSDHAFIGADCTIGAGAMIGDGTSLQSNTMIGPNAVIENSIVGADSRIGASAVLRDSIVGSGAVVGDGTVSPGRSGSLIVQGTAYTNQRVGGVIADRATVGSNTTIAPGVRVGPLAEIPHGVRLNDDVPEHSVVVG